MSTYLKKEQDDRDQLKKKNCEKTKENLRLIDEIQKMTEKLSESGLV